MGRPAKSGKALRKERIFEEALRLMDEGGEPAVTFRELANRLGVTAMAVKHHVGSRKELFQQLIARAFEGTADVPEELSGRAALLHTLEGYCERVIAHPVLMQSILASPDLMPEQLHSLTEQIRSYVSSLLSDESEVEIVVGLIADYTHGFATSVATYRGGSDDTEGLRLEDYRRGLEWVLGKLS
ncbi:TetR/AcrR family transcriptional regulator [Pseudovibrio brasiliensis]|uniref:TetR/AcrR family transcriptional regulator n=1 Tax=Pseudovibrio brasiliensis TaxID=1898042 RepID=A0ABX8AJM7_9HYPH|nr:TetR/AcrR family transcriptional regulator [Pseudovibrio brasiliensis]QUS55278.1 TetR/AcrR family transcriptional regulator [Pseudovibrio brasiliensis]